MLLLAFLDGRFLLTTGLLVGALLLGAAIIGFVRRWREMDARGVSANDQLAQYRTLYERGELSEAEFRKVREILTGKIREETGLSAPKPPPDEGIKPA